MGPLNHFNNEYHVFVPHPDLALNFDVLYFPFSINNVIAEARTKQLSNDEIIGNGNMYALNTD